MRRSKGFMKGLSLVLRFFYYWEVYKFFSFAATVNSAEVTYQICSFMFGSQYGVTPAVPYPFANPSFTTTPDGWSSEISGGDSYF